MAPFDYSPAAAFNCALSPLLASARVFFTFYAILLFAYPCSVDSTILNWDTATDPNYQGGDGRWSDRFWAADNNNYTGTIMGPWITASDVIFGNKDYHTTLYLDVNVTANTLLSCWTTPDMNKQGDHGPGTYFVHNSTYFETLGRLEIGNAENSYKMDAPYAGGTCEWNVSGTGQLVVGTNLVVSRFNYGNFYLGGSGSVLVKGNFYASSPGGGGYQTRGTAVVSGGSLVTVGDLVIGHSGAVDGGPFPIAWFGVSSPSATIEAQRQLVIAPGYLGGFFLAAGGQTISATTFVMWNGTVTAGTGCAPGAPACGFTAMRGSSHTVALIPDVDIYGGLVNVTGGSVIVNEFNPWVNPNYYNNPSFRSFGLVTLWGGQFITSPGVDFVLAAANGIGANTLPQGLAFVRASARLSIGGSLANRGGQGYFELRGGNVSLNGFSSSGGRATVLLADGILAPVPGGIIVTAGNLTITGPMKLDLGQGITFNVSASSAGQLVLGVDTTCRTGIMSAGPLNNRTVLRISGAYVHLLGGSIGQLGRLILSGTLHAVQNISAAQVTLSGSARFIPDNYTTVITGTLTRTAGASLVIILPANWAGDVSLLGGYPAVFAGIVPWAVVRDPGPPVVVDFVTYSNNLVTPFTGYNVVSVMPLGSNLLTETAVYAVDVNASITGTVAAYGLKVLPGMGISGSDATLALCPAGASSSGIILMGQNVISVSSLQYGACELSIYVEDTAVIQSALIGSGGLIKFGPGKLLLAGDLSQAAGSVTINDGSLETVGSGGSTLSNKNVVMPGGSSGVLRLNGSNVNIPVMDLGDADNSIIENGGTRQAALTAGIMYDSTWTGTIRDGGPAPLVLVKNGPGTLTVLGQMLLTGGMVINGGSIVASAISDMRVGIGNKAVLSFQDLKKKVFTQALVVAAGGGTLQLPDGSAGAEIAASVRGPGQMTFKGGDFRIKSPGYIEVGGLLVGADGVGANLVFDSGTYLRVTASLGALPFAVGSKTDGRVYSASVDMSKTVQFDADVSEFILAEGVYQVPVVAVVKLARNSNIRVRGPRGIAIGMWGTTMNYWQATSWLIFGRGTTNLRTPIFRVGWAQGVGSAKFDDSAASSGTGDSSTNMVLDSGGVINLDNGPGVRANLTVAEAIYSSNRFTFGTADFSRGTFNAYLDKLIVCDATSAVGEKWPIISASLFLGKGVIDANAFLIGRSRDNSRCRTYARVSKGAVMYLGDGGLVFDSDAFTSSCSALDLSGEIHLLGGQDGDFVVGMNMMGKCNHWMSINPGALINFAGHKMRYRSPNNHLFQIYWGGGEIRDVSYWDYDMPVQAQNALINITSTDCVWNSWLTSSMTTILVGVGRKMYLPVMDSSSVWSVINLYGTMNIGWWTDMSVGTLLGGESGRFVKVGAKKMTILLTNFRGDIVIDYGSMKIQGKPPPYLSTSTAARNLIMASGTEVYTGGTYLGNITVPFNATLGMPCGDNDARELRINTLVLMPNSTFVGCVRQHYIYIDTLIINGPVRFDIFSPWVVDGPYPIIRFNRTIGNPLTQFRLGSANMPSRTWDTFTISNNAIVLTFKPSSRRGIPKDPTEGFPMPKPAAHNPAPPPQPGLDLPEDLPSSSSVRGIDPSQVLDNILVDK